MRLIIVWHGPKIMALEIAFHNPRVKNNTGIHDNYKLHQSQPCHGHRKVSSESLLCDNDTNALSQNQSISRYNIELRIPQKISHISWISPNNIKIRVKMDGQTFVCFIHMAYAQMRDLGKATLELYQMKLISVIQFHVLLLLQEYNSSCITYQTNKIAYITKFPCLNLIILCMTQKKITSFEGGTMYIACNYKSDSNFLALRKITNVEWGQYIACNHEIDSLKKHESVCKREKKLCYRNEHVYT